MRSLFCLIFGLALLTDAETALASSIFPTEQERQQMLIEHVLEQIEISDDFAHLAGNVERIEIKATRRRTRSVQDCGLAWAGDCPHRERLEIIERNYVAQGEDFTCTVKSFWSHHSFYGLSFNGSEVLCDGPGL